MSKGKMEPTKTYWDTHLSFSELEAVVDIQKELASFTVELSTHLAQGLEKLERRSSENVRH